MKRLALAGVLVAVVGGTAFTFGDPFFGRSDTGDIVHVLPPPAAIRSPHDTAPTFAPVTGQASVFPPSYGSGNLIDHGGLEIANAGFWAIYWNGFVAGSTATSLTTSTHYATIAGQMLDFINNFPDNADYDGSATDDYEIVQQYGSTAPVANTLTNFGVFVDSQATASNISDSGVRRYLASLFNSGKVQPYTNVIYGVYFPSGMRVTLSGGASCTSFCGYHSHFTYGATGMQIKYAVFPYPNCAGCKLASLTVGDMLTIISSHEIRESVTDPGDFNVNAWYDAAGYEADDKCAWHNLYQIASGGFWVQPEYSNGGSIYPGPGCIVP